MLDSISRIIPANCSSRVRAKAFATLLVLLVSMLFVLPLSGVAQTTQTLSLESGWNTVSLYVQPSDSSFASLLDGTPVSMVKNEDGEVYLPGEGIEQIASWQSGEGYQVYTETSATLDVTAPKISPGAAVELKPGWNLVPYLSARAQAVEPALVSIEDALIVAEGGDGAQYDPSASSSPLDSLRPGQGYKVYVDRADTLRYPEVANTLEEALALEDVPIGSYVQVRGYHEAGDNGGGLFRVKNNACRTDGGTCFIFDEDRSTEQVVQEDSKIRGSLDLPDSDLSWRSFKLKWGANAEEVWPVEVFYGHNPKADRTNHHLNTQTGVVSDLRIFALRAEAFRSAPPSTRFEIKYKYATSDRRLERTGVTNAVNVAWWGAKPVSNGWTDWTDWRFRPEKDQTWAIGWATNRAERLVTEDGVSTAYVDFPDMYYKLFQTLIPNDVMLRGVGAEKEWPGGVVTKGGFKMPPGEAMWNDLQDEYKDQTQTFYSQRTKWGIKHDAFAERVGIGKHLEIDGNEPNNKQVWNNPERYGGWGAIGNLLQNGTRWQAWEINSRGCETPCPNQYPGGYLDNMKIEGRDVAIHDVGGNNLAGQSRVEWDVDGFFTSNSARNHQTYLGGSGPGIRNYTVEGWGWATVTKWGTFADAFENGNAPSLNTKEAHFRNGITAEWTTKVENITFQNLEQGPLAPNFDWNKLFNPETAHVDFDGVTVDLRGAPKAPLIEKHAFRGITFNDVEIWTPIDAGGDQLFTKAQPKKVRTFREYEISRYTNITVHDGLGGKFRLNQPKSNYSTNLRFEDVTIEPNGNDDAGTGPAVAGNLGMVNNLNTLKIPGAKRIVYDNVDWQSRRSGIAEINSGGGAASFPQDLFVIDSKINNQPWWSLKIKANVSEKYGRADRVYMSNTTFNIPLTESELDNNNYKNDAFHWPFTDGERLVTNTPSGDKIVKPHSTLRVRNCQTPNGRVSDSENNTFTSGSPSEGRDYVLISTSLLSRPREVDLTLASGSPNVSSITGWEVANSDGTLRPDDTRLEHDPYLKVNLDGTIQAGESVTIDWTARVTPKSEYTTTGLFISRPVLDYTSSGGNDPLQSGGGPWQIDLRGVAASQETWTPATYSATSSDTGVVTANVLEKKHRDLFYDWELELTEQGTGTATITVDAEIPGVGTAQTTFEVTVE
ncbi:hypothetical protein [Salinibacter sp.]|uniref:hypothetical protein n=1 Tax=Salinibacter sp. TaxID=2065818 RepID=UPI0021E72F96|nr:hypothetical protein [Salinibacter sp.]